MKKFIYSIIIFSLSIVALSCSNVFNSNVTSISITLPGNSTRAAVPDELSYYKIAVFSKDVFEEISSDDFEYENSKIDWSTVDETEEEELGKSFIDALFRAYATQFKLNEKPNSTINFYDIEEGIYCVVINAYDKDDKLIAVGESEEISVKNGETAQASVKMENVETPTEPEVPTPSTGNVNVDIDENDITILIDGKEVESCTLNRGDDLSLSVTGITGTYSVYIDGQSCRTNVDSESSAEIENDEFTAGNHEVMVVLTDANGKTYSKSIEVTVIKS